MKMGRNECATRAQGGVLTGILLAFALALAAVFAPVGPAAAFAETTGSEVAAEDDSAASAYTTDRELLDAVGESLSGRSYQTDLDYLDDLAAENADTIADGQYLISAAAKKTMALSGSSTTASLALGVDDETQFWTISHDSDGYLIITNDNTGLVLTVSGSSAAAGTEVVLASSTGARDQKWVAVEDEGGTIELISGLSSEFAIDLPSASTDAGTVPEIDTRDDSTAQRWVFTSVDEVYAELDALAAEYADTIADGIYIILNNKSGRGVLDVEDGSTSIKANIQLYGSNGTEAQFFQVTHDEQGYVIITNVKSGYVLDVSGGTAVKGTNIWQYRSNDSIAQKWIVMPDDLGGYTICSALWTDRVIDIAGGYTTNNTNIQLYVANGTAAQSFQFIATDSAETPDPCDDILVGDGWYTLGASCASGYVVYIKSGKLTSGTNAQLGAADESFAQLFQFEYVDGYYLIHCAGSSMALGVKNGDIISGANVAQYEADATDDAQLWSAQKNADGTYTFLNKATGLALCVEDAGTTSGTNIDAETPDGSTAQKFAVSEQEDLLIEGTYTISASAASSYVLDVTSGSVDDGAKIQLYGSNDTNAQKYYISKVSGQTNTYTIEATVSGKCLADESGRVVQRVSDGGSDQWWIPSISENGITFKNASTGKVITVSGGSYAKKTAITTTTSSGAAYQCFRLASATATLDEGYYYICLACASDMVLDVKSGSLSNSANVQLYGSNGTAAQTWLISKNSDGTYTITCCKSGKVLDVKGAKAVSGTNVQQYTSNGNNCQKWKITYAGGGWKITSALSSSLVLDIANDSTSAGANVQIYTSDGSTGQRFCFEPTEYTGISGDLVLDSYLNAIYDAEGTDLKDLFYYIVDDYTYIRTYNDDVSGDWEEWSIEFAKEMYEDQGGNCYRHAALFCWLAIGLGYDASVVTGYVPSRSSGWAPHGWVEIVIDGTTYVYDPDLAKDYPSLNWYKMTYSSAPITYKKSS